MQFRARRLIASPRTGGLQVLLTSLQDDPDAMAPFRQGICTAALEASRLKANLEHDSKLRLAALTKHAPRLASAVALTNADIRRAVFGRDESAAPA
jgi:hypothetical protein